MKGAAILGGVGVRCLKCSSVNSNEAARCGECGAAQVSFCPRCQARLPLDARYCLSCGRQLGKPPTLPGGPRKKETPTTVMAQRRQVTVLFADIPGFTAIASKLDAEDVHDFLNALWLKLDA